MLFRLAAKFFTVCLQVAAVENYSPRELLIFSARGRGISLGTFILPLGRVVAERVLFPDPVGTVDLQIFVQPSLDFWLQRLIPMPAIGLKVRIRFSSLVVRSNCWNKSAIGRKAARPRIDLYVDRCMRSFL